MFIKKPYLKKHSQIAGFTAWLVNGEYVRNKINMEFPNFGQHYRFGFIPRDEFWIDHETHPNEAGFYIEHMLVEYRLMALGKDYITAFDRANTIEKRERNKSKIMRELTNGKPIKIITAIDKIHRYVLYSAGALKVWLVNGEIARDLCLIYFNSGGHDLVYDFIPENEIWIDDDITPEERKFVIVHELRERNLMKEGWGYYKNSYYDQHHPSKIHHSAHLSASIIEHECRDKPEIVDKKIEDELQKICF